MEPYQIRELAQEDLIEGFLEAVTKKVKTKGLIQYIIYKSIIYGWLPTPIIIGVIALSLGVSVLALLGYSAFALMVGIYLEERCPALVYYYTHHTLSKQKRPLIEYVKEAVEKI